MIRWLTEPLVSAQKDPMKPGIEDVLMFLGEYQLNFSGKGRIVLPKKIRQEIHNMHEKLKQIEDALKKSR